MTELQIKQEFGKYYIVADYDVSKNEEYLVRMITDNKIEGHLQCHISYDGLRKCLMYDVTNMISLGESFSNKYIESDNLKDIFEEIQKIYTYGSKHLLDDKYYYLNPQYIYIDMQNNEIKLMYIPGKMIENENRFHALADFLLQRINRKDNECVQIAYQFYRMSCAETFSISMFLNVIEKETILNKRKISSEHSEEIVNEEFACETECMDEEHTKTGIIIPIALSCLSIVGIAIYFLSVRFTVYGMYLLIGTIVSFICSIILWVKKIYQYVAEREDDNIIIPLNPVTVDQYWGDDEETVVIQGNTVVLNENESSLDSRAKLEWKEKEKTKSFIIKSFPIVIGKMKGEVDCYVDDESVSRLHAKLIKRSNDLFIFDLNSTNGTFVDGKKLEAGEQIQVFQDTNIMLGNVVIRIVC